MTRIVGWRKIDRDTSEENPVKMVTVWLDAHLKFQWKDESAPFLQGHIGLASSAS